MPDRTRVVALRPASSSNKQPGPSGPVTRQPMVEAGPRAEPGGMDGFNRSRNFDQLPGQPRRRTSAA